MSTARDSAWWQEQKAYMQKSGDKLMALLDVMGKDGDWRARHDFAGIMGMIWPLFELAERNTSELASERAESREHADALRQEVDMTEDRALAAEATIEDAPHAVYFDDSYCASLDDGECDCWKSRVDTSALARHDAEVAARALRQAADSFDYPDLRWNTAEYETLVKVQKVLRARANTEERAK